MTISPTGSPNRSRRGFTLIEVLIAVVILTGGIVLVLGSFNASVLALEASRETMRANLLLKETMDDISENGMPPFVRGRFKEPDTEFQWEIEQTPVTAVPDEGLKEVSVTVWREGGRRRHSAATFLRITVAE